MITPDIIQSLLDKKGDLLRRYLFIKSGLSNDLKNLKGHELNALLLLSIKKPIELCVFLGTPILELEKLLNNATYKNYTIPKRRGGVREISEPEKKLKNLQANLNYYLQGFYLCIKPQEVHGFVVNPNYLRTQCNIVENAKPHTNKKHILNIDLKDFFPSITAKQVRDMFTSSFFNYDIQIATALTLLTTYQGKLPIGAPTSPVISNFICYQLDTDLINFCRENNLTYTRYADDLTFSSETLITDDHLLDIINLIKKNNFEINQKKVRLKSAYRKQTVTGLTVNEKVNVDRKLLKQIRAMLHDMTKNGVENATRKHFKTDKIEERHLARFIRRLEGYINFVGQVRGKNDSLYLKQKAAFDSVFV